MSYIQDEFFILKQNLIMLKHNIRLNKIEYTIALLLLIFYTLYIMGYLLAALSEGIIRLEFQSFDLFIISDLRITESDYIILAILQLLICFIGMSRLIQYRFNDSDLNTGGKLVSYCFAFALIFFGGIYIYRVFSTGLNSVTFEFSLYFWMSIRIMLLAFLFILLKHIPRDLKYGSASYSALVGNQKIIYHDLIEYRKSDESIIEYIGLNHIFKVMKKTFITDMLNIKGRQSRSQIIWCNLIFIITIALLNLIISTMIQNQFVSHMWHDYIAYIFYYWLLLADICMIIRRLHDSGASALWLLGLWIPYVNIYVLYLILFKPSIIGVEMNKKEECKYRRY